MLTSNAPTPVGPYSQAVKANGVLYISGQVPLTPKGEKVSGDIQAQTHQVLSNVKAIVEAANAKWEHIVKVNIFLTDMNDFAKVNQVYGHYFKDFHPARSCVQVAALPLGVNVEIEATVLAPEQETAQL